MSPATDHVIRTDATRPRGFDSYVDPDSRRPRAQCHYRRPLVRRHSSVSKHLCGELSSSSLDHQVAFVGKARRVMICCTTITTSLSWDPPLGDPPHIGDPRRRRQASESQWRRAVSSLRPRDLHQHHPRLLAQKRREKWPHSGGSKRNGVLGRECSMS
jgi:hypothetical protein